MSIITKLTNTIKIVLGMKRLRAYKETRIEGMDFSTASMVAGEIKITNRRTEFREFTHATVPAFFGLGKRFSTE